MSESVRKVRYSTGSHQKTNGRHNGSHNGHNGKPRTLHVRRDARLDELIAAYAAKGLSLKLLREVAALATSKGIKKLTHGFTC